MFQDLERPVCCKQAEARDQEKCIRKLTEEAEQEWLLVCSMETYAA